MFFARHNTVKFLPTTESLCIKCISIAVLMGLGKPVPVPLRSHWQAESQDCWTRSGRDEGCLIASHSRLSRRDPRPRRARVSSDQLDCPLRPLRSTASYQFRHIGHWVWLAIGDGASAQVEPALRRPIKKAVLHARLIRLFSPDEQSRESAALRGKTLGMSD